VDQPASVCGYEVLAELGRGTTGVVYRARHRFVKPNRVVALKVPLLGSVTDTTLRLACHRREWQALARLTREPDPAFPTLYDVGSEGLGQPSYYAREFVDGSTLEQLATAGTLAFRGGVGILAAVAGAVQRVHGRGIAHRNLRPSNVLVSRDGTPKLIGFGLVWVLPGSDRLPPGISGAAEVDIRALQEMLGWLGAVLGQPLPPCLGAIRQPGSVRNPAAFAEALGSFLPQGPAEPNAAPDRGGIAPPAPPKG
jgi:serine/threonine protein kinase